MLLSLRVKNFLLLKEAYLEFSNGFKVIKISAKEKINLEKLIENVKNYFMEKFALSNK